MRQLHAISLVNVIPTYMCNLSCGHCLFSHKRQTKNKALSIDQILKVFSIIKQEGALCNLHVEWYGGEISLLGHDYLKQGIQVVKSIFPQSSHSVISNLIGVNDEWLHMVQQNCTHLCTSYEEIRFKDGDDLYKIWSANVQKAMKLLTVDCIVMLTRHLNGAFNVIDRFPFGCINAPMVMVPEDVPSSIKNKIMKYVVNIDEYMQLCLKSISRFGADRSFQAMGTEKSSIVNVLHIYPDGSVGLPGPSKLGYPYEKNYIFYRYGVDNDILKSQKRIKYIASQLLLCKEHDCTDKICLAEFKYPNFCMGYLPKSH